MIDDRLARPVFLVGMGRSGSTVLFECVATHPDLGWFAHHANRFPRATWLYGLSRATDHWLALRKSIERSDERRPWIEKLRLGPAEAYETWERLVGARFRYDWLVGIRATDRERAAVRAYVTQMLRWSGKRRFAAKVTGPPRIGFIASLFPDAVFVHVVRDGRAVATSLLHVDFWRDSHRMREPAWRGLPERHLRAWRESGGSSLALAAVQWRYAIEAARQEAVALAPGQYHEVRYEDFLADPHGLLDSVQDAVGLAPSARVHRFLSTRFELRDRNAATRATLDPAERALLDALLGDLLRELGYEPGDAAPNAPRAPALR